jgi:hypothetical protein
MSQLKRICAIVSHVYEKFGFIKDERFSNDYVCVRKLLHIMKRFAEQ